VFACHWPSKMHKESERLANAALLASRLASIPRGKDYVVAGDFNEDYDECETFRTAGLDDTRGVTGLNHVLGTVSSAPGKFLIYRRKADVASDSGVALYDPWLELPEERRLSSFYKGRPETPDHILLPGSLFDTAALSYVDNSFAPFTWNGRLMKDGAPYRWQMRYTKSGPIHTGEGFSDHLPAAAKLCRKPYRMPEEPTAGSSPRSVSSGGFEDGVDGWVSCVKHVRVFRDSLFPHAGAYCLAIAGRANSNASAARCRVCGESCDGTPSLSLWLKGSGCLSLRIRAAGGDAWTYYRGEDFEAAKAGKYCDISLGLWTHVSLPLNKGIGKAKEVEVEVRTKKDKEIKLFVDDVKMACNDR